MHRFFLKLRRRRNLQKDLETELAFHREMAGSHEDHIPLGNTVAIQESARDLWRFNLIENLWRDLTYAARGLQSRIADLRVAFTWPRSRHWPAFCRHAGPRNSTP